MLPDDAIILGCGLQGDPHLRQIQNCVSLDVTKGINGVLVISLKPEGLIVFLEMMWQALALEYNHKSLFSASYNLLHYYTIFTVN